MVALQARNTVAPYMLTLDALGVSVFLSIALALQLRKTFFFAFVSIPAHSLRLSAFMNSSKNAEPYFLERTMS